MRISNVYEECGSIITLTVAYGDARTIICIYVSIIFFLRKELKIGYSRLFWMCFLLSPWMERFTTIYQLTDMKKSAERLKTN